MLSPHIGTTYAPCGRRPSIQLNCSVSTKFYMASAISEQGALIFHSRQNPYDTDGIIDFLKILLTQIPSKILIVWDGASIHKSKKLKAFLSEFASARRLHLVIQPSYSPHLNADEQVWQRVKNVALKNTCFQNFKELKTRVIKEMNILAKNTALVKKFFHHPDLAFNRFNK